MNSYIACRTGWKNFRLGFFMSETIHNKTVFTLLEVAHSIQRTLNERYRSSFWVKAEMNKLNHYSQSGHCYPELLEKNEEKIVAQVRATLWKDDYLRINENFLTTLKEPLKNGINILFHARILFDPVYGLSLRILDIDPSWSLGELEREKQKSMERLKEEQLFFLNKSLPLPLLPQRIAVISVETSKGFADFQKVIDQNPWKYKFFYLLFPSLLQGDKMAEAIVRQLQRIEKVKHHFDVVAIIRGGGGDVGLSGYNRYELAKSIACFPLPVITGIGHVTNETVSEMVAFKNCITPTELADFLIQQFHNFAIPVNESRKTLISMVNRQIADTKKEAGHTISLFLKHTKNLISTSRQELLSHARRVKTHSGFYIRNARGQVKLVSGSLKKNSALWMGSSSSATSSLKLVLIKETTVFFQQRAHEIELREKQVSMLDPKNVLARGFSITLFQDKAIRSPHVVRPGDAIKTVTFEGAIESTVTTIQPEPGP